MKKENVKLGQKVFFMKNDKVNYGIINCISSKQIATNSYDVLNNINNNEPLKIEFKDIFKITVLYKLQSETKGSSTFDTDAEFIFETKQDLLESL